MGAPPGTAEADGEQGEQDEDAKASAPVDPAGLPSAGSAKHAEGLCKRCCFFPKGRCQNGFKCEFCHFEHEKRKRKKKKKGSKRDESDSGEEDDNPQADAHASVPPSADGVVSRASPAAAATVPAG